MKLDWEAPKMKNDRALLNVTRSIAAVILLSPTPLVAGGYGSTAVADAQVSNQQVAQGTVWCERLDASVTESLFRQMDCGSGSAGFASPAVAGERVTNGGGFFQRFPHRRGETTVTSGDSDSDMLTSVSGSPTNGDPNTGGPSTDDPNTDDPNTDGPVTGTPITEEPDKPKKDKKKKDKKKKDKKKDKKKHSKDDKVEG